MQLRPMRPEELEPYLRHLAVEYGAEQASTGRWRPDEATGNALAEMHEELPDGVATRDHRLFVAEDEAGRIGVLWIGLHNPRGVPDLAWINDIEIDEGRRGAGLGRRLLTEAERVTREEGIGWLGLNVFGRNSRARALYESAGYETTSLQMRKRLRPG
jgi:GNAT superfamily N-acetyltransferase